MRRNQPRLVVSAAILLGSFSAAPLGAQEVRPGVEKSREQAYYERIIRAVEPDLVGRPERLEVYLRLFEREMIDDPRRFPFHVEAEQGHDGRVVLKGFVGYDENRTALLKFMEYLGFEDIDNRIEVLPSEKLGARRFGLVTAAHTLSYHQPAGRREVVTDCLLGAPLYLLHEADDGFFLCLGVEGYVGYVDGKDVRRVDAAEFARFQEGDQVRVRRDLKVSGDVLLPTGARLKYVGRQGDRIVAELPSGDKALLPSDYCEIDDDRPDPRVERAIQNAARLLGTRYLWGGNTSEGIDCSGLVQTAFAAEGIHLPRDANQQAHLGRLTATRWHRQGLRRGDTLYFLGGTGKISHTALYLGDGRYIESVRPVVRYTSFDPNDEAYDQRRAAAFCFAKRLLD